MHYVRKLTKEYLRPDFPPEVRVALEDMVKELLAAVERHEPVGWVGGGPSVLYCKLLLVV